MCVRDEELEEPKTVHMKTGRGSQERGILGYGQKASQGLRAGYWIGDEETVRSAQQWWKEGEAIHQGLRSKSGVRKWRH